MYNIINELSMDLNREFSEEIKWLENIFKSVQYS